VGPLRLTYQGPRYLDRTLPLETGEVKPEGIHLEVTPTQSIGGLLQKLVIGEADLAELLLGEYIAHAASGASNLIALPVFPARRFAHRWLWVSSGSELESVEDLRGKRIGWPTRASGGLAWALRLLHSTAAIGPEELELVHGRIGGSLSRILDGADEDIDGRPLVERLLNGEIDCVLSPYPIPAGEGGDKLRLLLRAPHIEERSYIRAGHAMPVLTVVALRQDVYQRDRWIAWALTDAFSEAKALGRDRLNYFGALAVSLPWLSAMLEEVDALFDGDAYPYGLARNRTALEEYLTISRAAGLLPEAPPLDDLFALEVIDHPGVPDSTRYDVPMRGTH
jgi:4,5-dihydroxyphthalate decarboxylase